MEFFVTPPLFGPDHEQISPFELHDLKDDKATALNLFALLNLSACDAIPNARARSRASAIASWATRRRTATTSGGGSHVINRPMMKSSTDQAANFSAVEIC
jgi:hypothetical protein